MSNIRKGGIDRRGCQGQGGTTTNEKMTMVVEVVVVTLAIVNMNKRGRV
jgi:hypothetical protein